ncbi:MAG: tetratricopeptide repeat protein [Spirochaetaceae bacterium]
MNKYELKTNGTLIKCPTGRGGTLFITLLLLSVAVSVFRAEGQEIPGDEEINSESPAAWMVMLDGKEEFRKGNFGTALSLFREVADRDETNADAHLWIGYVFEAEGEFELAKQKFIQSLEHEKRFAPHEGRIAARYALARIAEKTEDIGLYKETLSEIIAEGRSKELSDAAIDAMIRHMRTEGPDKVLELYRVREKAVRKAYSLRAEQALREEDYEKAVEDYTVSFAVAMTTAIEALQRRETDYTFIEEPLPVSGRDFYISNTRRFLNNTRDNKKISEYFQSIRFYREVFLFAFALYGAEYTEQAEDLWLLIAEHRESGVWSSLAREQASTPNLEKLPSILER